MTFNSNLFTLDIMDISTDEAYKDRIGERLTLRMAQALKDGEITEDELPVIASYLLENIDKCKNSSEIFDFLVKIAKKWSFFENILTIEHGQILEKQEEEQASKVEDLIKQNKIDDALKVAENAMDRKEKLS